MPSRLNQKISITLAICMCVIATLSIAFADNDSIKNVTLYDILDTAGNKAVTVFDKNSDSPVDLGHKITRDIDIRTDDLITMQRFYFLEDDTEHFFIISNIAQNPLYLSAQYDESVTKGDKITLKSEIDKSGNSNRWVIKPEGGGEFAILSAADEDLALTAMGENKDLYLMPYNESVHQLWSFQSEGTLDVDSSAVQEFVKNNKIVEKKENSRVNSWLALMSKKAGKASSIDFDGYYGAQCVDLAYHYTYYLFHDGESRHSFRKSINGGNGGEIFARANPNGAQYYEKITYYNGFVAQPGDIVVFKYHPSRGRGHWGHVAVVESATEDALNVFTQNGSERGTHIKRSVYKYSTYAKFNYSEIVGFLRPIESKMISQ